MKKSRIVFLLCCIAITAAILSPVTANAAKKKVTSVITTAYEEIFVNIGNSKGIRAEVTSGPEGQCTFTSSDTSVVKVNKKGKVTGLKAGSCTVTVTAPDGTEKLIPVTVRPNAKKLKLNKSKLKLAVMDTYRLTAAFSPEGSYQKVTWTSSDESIATVSKKGLVKALKDGEVTITATSSAGLTKSCTITCYYSKYIAITFDDGPGQYTETLLDALKEMDVHVTFFMVGQNVSRYASLVDRMKKEGHELGNHTWDHPTLTTMSADQIRTSVSKTSKAIKEACGSNPTLLRPPYGSYNNTVLLNIGFPAVTWSVDTLDWKYRDADYVEKTVISQAKEGAIVLLHDIHKTSVEGAIRAIKKLKKQGWGFLTVTGLLTQNGETLTDGKVYYKYIKK